MKIKKKPPASPILSTSETFVKISI